MVSPALKNGAVLNSRLMRNKLVALSMLLSLCAYAQKIKPPLYFSADSKSFSATGRWVPSNQKDKAAFPSETEIDCDRSSKTCVEADAEYYSGHPHVSITYFEIAKWNENQIIATSSSGICMEQTILISIPDKTISNTHSMKKLDAPKKEACSTIGASGTQADLFIVKNSPQWNSDPYGESSNKY
jgi:hypothetical protein